MSSIATILSSLGQLIEKEITGCNRAVPGNNEFRPGVTGRLTGGAGPPADPPAISQFRGLGNRLILEVRMSRPDRTRNAIDFIPAAVDARFGIIEHAIIGPELVDGRAPARGVVFTEYVLKITGQQGRDAVGHGLSPLVIVVRLEISRRAAALASTPKIEQDFAAGQGMSKSLLKASCRIDLGDPCSKLAAGNHRRGGANLLPNFGQVFQVVHEERVDRSALGDQDQWIDLDRLACRSRIA